MQSQNSNKIVVFDLDETLGSFSELGALVDSLRMIYGHELSNEYFFKLLDTYPKFLRPNILNILNTLVAARRRGDCLGIIMYTNNQGPKKWAKLISNYFDYKIGASVFDMIIHAYKVNGRVTEPKRTSHNKNFNDLLRCTMLPKDTLVCFVDDQYHSLASHPNVLYIPVEPYVHKPNVHHTAKIYHRHMNSAISLNDLTKQLTSLVGNSWKHPGSTKQDSDESEHKLKGGLELFLGRRLQNTRKKHKYRSNVTRKHRPHRSRRKKLTKISSDSFM